MIRETIIEKCRKSLSILFVFTILLPSIILDVSVNDNTTAKTDHVFLTNDGRSGSFAVALIGGDIGAKEEVPLLLIAANPLNTLTKNYIADYTCFRYVLGGESGISSITLAKIINPIFQTPEADIQPPDPASGNASPLELDSAKLNHEFLKYINKERARFGVGLLSYMAQLQRGTDIRTKDIISNDEINHIRPNGFLSIPYLTILLVQLVCVKI